MNRQLLLGAVIGCAVTSAASLITFYLTKSGPVISDRTITVLVFRNSSDDLEKVTASDPSEEALASNAGAKILRDCGAWYFETESEGGALGYNAIFPLIPKNSEALECVLRKTQEADVPMKIDVRWEASLKARMDSANSTARNND